MDKKTVEHIESLQGENARLRALLAESMEDSSARIRELEAMLSFQKEVNASDLRMLRATESALDLTHVKCERLTRERDEARAEVERHNKGKA